MDKQKDFEKGWEEYKAKSKQEIKEMIGIIQNAVGGCAEYWANLIAEELHKSRYRKISENEVVLTKEEFSEKIENTWLNCQEFTRKETAQKFAEMAKNHRSIKGLSQLDGLEAVYRYICEGLNEIAKELTEGKI